MSGNRIQYVWKCSVLGIIALMATLVIQASIPTIETYAQGTRWSSPVFEDVINLDYSPREPRNMEPVNVTIESKDYEPINTAHLYIEYTDPDGNSGSGGYVFNWINASKMYAIIPGYEGGTTVSFYVEAWDSKNNMVRSQEYSYVVVRNGTWKSDTFEDNINLTYVPTEPKIGDKVEVIIASRYSDVPIARAELHFTVDVPGFKQQSGLVNFNKITPLKWNASINPYPGGSNITFWVVAYDSYYTPLTSEKYMYSIPKPPPTAPHYSAVLMVVVKDIANAKYAEGALVIFKNDTWSYTTQTTNGIAFTPMAVSEGEYDIYVAYMGKNYTKNITVPNAGQDYVVDFNVNEKPVSVPFNMEKGINIGFLIGIVLAIILILGAMRYKRELMDFIGREKAVIKEKDGEGKALKENDKGLVGYMLSSEERRATVGTFAAFAFLGIFGALWAPFYPWWMVIIIALVTGAVAVKTKYLSMLILTVFTMASTAYQAPEFGLIYAIFAFIILVITLFSLEFGYFTFATIYLSRFGLSFLPIAVATVLYPVSIGIGSFAASYTFIYLVLYNSNIYSLGGVFSPLKGEFIATFSRTIADRFGIAEIVDRINSTAMVNLNYMGEVMHSNLQTPVPILYMIAFSAMIYVLYRYIKGVMVGVEEKERIKIPISNGNVIKVALLVGVVMMVLSLVGGFIYSVPLSAMSEAISIPIAILVGVYLGDCIRLTYPERYIIKGEVEGVGKSISDVQTLRKTTFEWVGGLEDVKQEIKESIIIPLLKPELAKRYGVTPSKGILMFGPPGCGKTLLMRAIASELNVDMIYIKCSDIMSKWYGESENTVARLFEEARRRKPCIVFLDEIDAITKRRDFYSTDDVTPRILSIMLAELDGMEEAEGIIFVGSTNMPDIIDPAIMRPGRFDKVIYVPPPAKKARKAILNIHTKGRPLASDVDLAALAKKTRGFSGADLANLVKEAAILAMREALEKGTDVKIAMRHFNKALVGMRPSITPEMVRAYEKLKENFERRKGRRPKKPGVEQLNAGGPVGKKKIEPTGQEPVSSPTPTHPKVPPLFDTGGEEGAHQWAYEDTDEDIGYGTTFNEKRWGEGQ